MVPPLTTSTFDADASVRKPSRNITVSTASWSAASWRISTLPRSEIVFRSQRCQRLSSAVTTATPLLDGVARRRGERIAHHEDGRRHVLRERVVALRHAARHLEIDALVRERLAADELAHQRLPLRVRVRIGEADAVEAALQPREVMRQAERLAGVDGNQFVDAVAEDEAAVQHGHFRFAQRDELAVQERRSDRDRTWSGAVLGMRRLRQERLNHRRIVSHARPKNPAGRHFLQRDQRKLGDGLAIERDLHRCRRAARARSAPPAAPAPPSSASACPPCPSAASDSDRRGSPPAPRSRCLSTRAASSIVLPDW